MKTCPFHPKPHKNKASVLKTFLLKRRSWLDGLYEKSYKMKTGRVKMPGFDLHIINEPKIVRQMLVDEVENYPKSTLLHELLEPLLGCSVFTTNDEVWQKQRDLLNPAFELTKISAVFYMMNDAAKDLLARLASKDSDFVEIDSEMSFTTADVIYRTIMSEKLDEKQGKIILDAFVVFQEQSARSAIRKMFCIPEFISLLLGEKKRRDAGKIIKNSLAKIIKPRFDSYPSEHKDILASLLATIDPDTNKRFSFNQILDQVAMLFLAGHETTASSLTWTLYILALAQDEQERAYCEISEFFDPSTPSSIKKLKYLSNVYKESLRLYPPVGFFARQARNDCNIRGKLVKSGTGIVIAPWLIHRHEELWENPHEFCPDRFDGEIKKDSYMPFGMGKRVCIGQAFATQEALIILSQILKTYRISLKDGFVPDVVGRLTIRSANGMPLRLVRR